MNGRTVTLISPSRYTTYSGMLPGLLAGYYSFDEAHIDLKRLTERCGINFLIDSVVRFDPHNREVEVGSGARRTGTVVSFDVGSVPAAEMIPGARAHAVCVKPADRFLSRIEELSQAPGRKRVTIVGGGAAGVELTFALQARFGSVAELTLVHRGATLLGGHPPGLARHAHALLRKRGVTVLTNASVTAIHPTSVVIGATSSMESHLTILTTDASAPGFLQPSGIRTDPQGFILTSESLQSVSHPSIFAAGDVSCIENTPLPKSGVYAVRQGAPLARNLLRVLDGEPLERFLPQRKVLALLGTADREAYISWGPIWWRNGALWRIKESIDRRFMKQCHECKTAYPRL
jgi:selenide, water dikinase